MPPMTPFGSVLHRVSEVPPPRSSVTTRIWPSEVTSDWCEIETSCGFDATSFAGGLSFGATPIVETVPERTFRTSTSTVSLPTAETYIVRPFLEKCASCGLQVPGRPFEMHCPVAAPVHAALVMDPAWTIRYFLNGWDERRSTTSTEPCVRGLIIASQVPLGWMVALCAPPLGDAETQPRRWVVKSRGRPVVLEPQEVDAAARALPLEARRDGRVDAGGERIEADDGEVAAHLDVVLPAAVRVLAGQARLRRVGHVEDLQTLAHRAEERVVVSPVVRAARLELDVRADEAADVRDVDDVPGRARREPRSAQVAARKGEVVRRVERILIRRPGHAHRRQHRHRQRADDEPADHLTPNLPLHLTLLSRAAGPRPQPRARRPSSALGSA